jgi:hypothetical protein
MKKARDMSKLHENKETTMEEGKETKMEKKGYKETMSGKMVKAEEGKMVTKDDTSEYVKRRKKLGGADALFIAKGGMTKSQKKIKKVMGEYKEGTLHSGKSGPVVKNPKQAIAIALSEAGKSKKMKSGGMSEGAATRGFGVEMKKTGGSVRGSGAAIKGVRSAKMY